MINVIRCDVYLSFTYNLFPYQLKFCHNFSHHNFEYMFFWPLKDA